MVQSQKYRALTENQTHYLWTANSLEMHGLTLIILENGHGTKVQIAQSAEAVEYTNCFSAEG